MKIADFGNSKICIDNNHFSDSHGSIFYVAPEVLNKNYSIECDMWSIGVMTYTLLTGSFPFDYFSSNKKEEIKMLKNKILNQ